MTVTPLGPTTAARRQITHDRLTELFADKGCRYPDALADDVMAIHADLGWALPRALDDPPPPAAGSTAEGRAAARALFEQARADALALAHAHATDATRT